MAIARTNSLSVAVVLLAAGASARMGRPKLLLPWGGSTVLGHLVGQWRALAARQIGVVLAADSSLLNTELDRVGISASDRILNPRPNLGMFSSIRCAARWNGWTAGLTHFAITLGDQPLVRVETLRCLLDFCAANREKICQPSRKGRGRHPVIMPASNFRQLRDATETNLKEFLANRSGERTLCEMDDAGLDFDLDEPTDYERALQFAASTETAR